MLGGAPEGIRTPDPQIRSLVLYPAELPAPWEKLTQYLLRRGFSRQAADNDSLEVMQLLWTMAS